MQKITTLTMNPTIDKSTSVGSVAPEIKLRCEQPRFDPGGGGINVSRAIQKLGGTSRAIYPAGGPTGVMLKSLLENEGIDQHIIPMQGLTRESLTVFESSTALQYRFGMPGPEMGEDEWRLCLDAVIEVEADILVASGSLPPGVPDDFYAQVARTGRDRGMKIIVDTSGAALHAVAQSGVYLIKPNLAEMEVFSGERIKGEEHLKLVTQSLIADGLAEVVLVSMGASGAALVTAEDYVHFHAPVVPIQSKVGAGDSMVGGLVYGLSQGQSLVEAAKLGVAAGTAAVMTPGTQLCRREDVERLYTKITTSA